jgi:putative addiction module component (TIGR02574 family)
MSLAAQKIAEMLALPERDRANLVRQLIASLDPVLDSDAETEWRDVLDRRTSEIEQGAVTCRPMKEAVAEIRKKLDARRQPS